MYKIQLAKFTPFWNNNDVNFPDTTFDNPNLFSLDSPDWDDVARGSLEWTASNSAWIQIDVVQFKVNYLRVWDDYKEQMYYFFVMDFFDMTTKTVKLNLELDIWATYHKNVLDELKNENPITFFNKKHMNRYTILDNLELKDDVPVDVTLSESKEYIWDNEIKLGINDKTVSPQHIFLEEFIVPENVINEIVTKYKKLLNDYNIKDTGSTITTSYSVIQLSESQEGIHSRNSLLDFRGTTLFDKINYWTGDVFGTPTTLTLAEYTPTYEVILNRYITQYLNVSWTKTSSNWRFTLSSYVERLINNDILRPVIVAPETIEFYNYHIASQRPTYPSVKIKNTSKKFIVTFTINLKGTTSGVIPIPKLTSYALDFNGTQQYLMNEDDLSNLGDNKINTQKINFEINKRKFNTYKIYKDTGLVDETWEPNAENKFRFKNGYYMYGVIKFPYAAKDVIQQLPLTNFLMGDVSNNLFIYVPILNNNVITGSFTNNTRAFIEGSFGENLLGVITTPISPLTISQKAVTIKKLFNNLEPYNDPRYNQLSGFISDSFLTTERFTFSKNPNAKGIFSVFTPPVTEEEKWTKKLTTLTYENEPLLLSPQYLEYYITNGINEITTNNYVTPMYADKNYIDMSWGFSPVSAIIYLNGLYDINRFEPQKNVITFTGNLPSNSSTYNQWILENSASINMGLAAAKDSSALQQKYGAVNVATGLMSMLRGGVLGGKGMGRPEFSTLASVTNNKKGSAPTYTYDTNYGNFGAPNAMKGSEGMIQGVKDIAKGAYQIDKAKLDYKNYQRQISGMNSDAMTKSTLITTDDASYINTFASLAPLSVMFLGLKPSDCNTIWWNAHINGYNVNRTFNFNEYDNRTFFNYFQVSDISPSVLRVRDIPMIYKDWFIAKFEDGIRLWKTWYDYKLDNKEVFVSRIDDVVIGVKDEKSKNKRK